MKVVHINTSSIGGAAKAAINLHEGLLREGIDSVYLYMNGPEIDVPHAFQIKAKFSFIEKVLFKTGLRKHYWQQVAKVSAIKKNNDIPFTISYTDFDILKSEQAHIVFEADIIHLHWITNCIDYSTFFNAISKPIFWTLHDMNAFTGGCHYDNACIRFQNDCGDCPQLNFPESKWVAKNDLEGKNNLKKNNNIHIISLNNWMMEKAIASSLFKKYTHHVVSNSVDTGIFNEQRKPTIQIIGDNKSTKKKIGYVATYHSELKGSDIFLALVEKYKTRSDVEFSYIGQEYMLDLANCSYGGNLKTAEELADFYRSIDLLIVPSRADNLPNVIIEAICCGTPVFASEVGGIPTLINQDNGRLIPSFEIEDWTIALDEFDKEMKWFDRKRISTDAINLYNKKQQVQKILKLYSNLI